MLASQTGRRNDVFVKWHDGMTSDYTWEKITAEALVSTDVGSVWLLEELYKKLEVTPN